MSDTKDSEEDNGEDAQGGDSAGALSAEEQTELERDALLDSVAAAKLDGLQERVAWILNRYPNSPDSDVGLMLRLWEEFHPDVAGGGSIAKEDLYRLPRLTSITRSRATIQNKYKLFQASPQVRQARGQLSEEEKAKAVAQQLAVPAFDVYADESGKTAKYLIVGSVWCLHPPELLQFRKDMEKWRESRGFHDELHFKTISESNLHHYRVFADELVTRNAVFSFKALTVERAGVKSVDDALREMFFHLLVRGVEHEHATGRAPLPRSLMLWKDREEIGRDKLFLAALKERMLSVSGTRFGGNLYLDEFVSTDSAGKLLIQVADLYTSSINRVLNAEGKRTGAKDQLADYLLNALGLPKGPQDVEQAGDMASLIAL